MRGLSTLFILKRLMKEIKRIETEKDPNTLSSFHPLKKPVSRTNGSVNAKINGRNSAPLNGEFLGKGKGPVQVVDEDDSTADFYPCHYIGMDDSTSYHSR